MAGTPKVIILSEQLRGQSFELTKEEYSIGRTEDCDICVPDPTISSHHCTLRSAEAGGYAVTDEGSTNGTRVNGEKIEAKETQALVNSDILQVGGVEMLFDCEDTRGTGATSTHTVINLENTKTGEMPVSEMANFSPFGPKFGDMRSESKKTKLILACVIGLLIVAVLVSLVVLLFKMVGVSA